MKNTRWNILSLTQHHWVYFVVLAAFIMVLGACGSPEPPPPPAIPVTSATATPVPDSAPVPTSTLVPTATPVPTATSVPTAIPGPTATPVPAAAPVPTATPVPATAPVPTATPVPATAPVPTATSVPTATPVPTAVPTPTAIPTPTATPTPTAIPLAPAPTFVASTAFDSFSEEVQKTFTSTVDNEFTAAYQTAGFSVAVFDGKKLWTAAFGIASDTNQMTPTTPMIIRSTSKTFLSAMMLTQIEDGLYSLTDTVETLLSDHPDYALVDIDYINTDVTVEQLLTMTSGISDWSSAEHFDKRIQIMLAPTWKPADNLSMISSPFVKPGSYHYSWANSILLGLITAHKGGKNLNALYQETFFKPLGLSGGLLTEVVEPPDTATAYDDLSKYGAGSGFGSLRAGRMAIFKGKDPRISWAGAGIVSTPENIARWGFELFSSSGSALSSAAQAQLINSLTVQTDPSMSSIGIHTYGYYIGMADVGLSDGTSIKTYNHPGGGGGRTSWLYYAPSLDVSISLLANSMALHDLGSCGYKGQKYMSVGECIAGGIFSTLLGMPVERKVAGTSGY